MSLRNRFGRGSAMVLASLAGISGLAAVTASTPRDGQAPAVAQSRTIGLVITSWRYAFVETPDYKECEGGLQPGEVAQLKASAATVQRLKAEGGTFENRGPNGETGHFSPLVVEDPLPWHELITKTGYGANLDGTQDGRATRKTCKHEKFTSAEGEKVDNQSARVLGCVMGWRDGGQIAEFYNNEIVNSQINRHLIEVSGVDDEMNDPEVQVTIYKGLGRLVRTGDNKFVPFLSQRVDPRFPKYNNHKGKGRIVNGMLITDPLPYVVFPLSSERNLGDRKMRDMTLRLKLTAEGADGILAGYDNWNHVYLTNAKRVVAELSKYSSPSLYRAFMRNADGYPDESGQCQYISAAYKVKATRAMIVHPPKGRINIAQN